LGRSNIPSVSGSTKSKGNSRIARDLPVLGGFAEFDIAMTDTLH